MGFWAPASLHFFSSSQTAHSFLVHESIFLCIWYASPLLPQTQPFLQNTIIFRDLPPLSSSFEHKSPAQKTHLHFMYISTKNPCFGELPEPSYIKIRPNETSSLQSKPYTHTQACHIPKSKRSGNPIILSSHPNPLPIFLFFFGGGIQTHTHIHTHPYLHTTPDLHTDNKH
ncbi:hypothetical protein PGTUg99_050251 [Puccinia graminis f. sp. tritici]|uniref:Uncharacterized protein n=1 Tax=Puccinia graminis f. sp. tritici TaxID=56615 RepID=A0A5B0QQM5_PUCGR|nr:hypothetical protein PGTUg99_050251 [Puccinia graminis f. sp. tritici]